MDRREPVGSFDKPSDFGSGDAEGLEFIRCVDEREPHIREVWTFSEDGVTHEVHLTVQVDIGARVVGEFASN